MFLAFGARLRRLPLAVMVILAVVAATVMVGGAAPARAASAAVSAAEAPRAGGEIAISGTGFDGSGFGLYLSVREVGTSNLAYTVWIDDTNVDDPDSSMPTAAMTADGAFTIHALVPAFVEGVEYEIYTRGAHGMPNPANTLTQPIAYEAAPVVVTETTTSLVAAPASATKGDEVQLTATVVPATAGTVAFAAGATQLGSVAVSGGQATLATTTLPVGTTTVTATFTPEEAALFTSSVGTTTVTVAEVETPETSYTPELAVFLADGTTPYTGQPVYDNDVLVVRGSGFDPAGNIAPEGSRPPVSAGKPAGTYVVLASTLAQWKPSTGAAGSSRKAVDQKWAMSQAALDAIAPAYQSTVRAQWTEVDASGGFETELTAKNFASALSGGSWGVLTYAAGGVVNAAQDLRVAINYVGARPTVVPAVTVTPSENLDSSVENNIVVAGTGFTGAAAADGVYVGLGSSTVWPAGTAFPSTGWTDVKWIPARNIVDGSFTATFTVAADTLTPGGEYMIATSAAHAMSITNRTLDTRSSVTVAEEVVAERPTLTLSSTSALDPNVANTVTVVGTGFTGPSAAFGAYISLGDSALWSGGTAYPATGWIDTKWIMPGQIQDGSFTATFEVPAGTLNPAKSYQIASSAAHALSVTNRTLDAFVDVPVLDTTVDPAIRLSVDSVRQGGTLVVSGVGFVPGSAVSVEIHSDVHVFGSATVGADGEFALEGTIPIGFAAGAHTVVATSGDISVTAPLTVTKLVISEPVDKPKTPAEPVCVAQATVDAWFDWDVKSSFRSYIEGPIASGSYAINWTGGSGAFNTEESRGSVAFGGSATFTGHSGALDVVISNPRVRMTGAGEAQLLVDVNSAGYAGKPGVNAGGIVFATLALPEASVSGATYTFSGASATLTADGAAAFMGFYNTGDVLDSVSFGFALGADVPCDETTSGKLAMTGAPDAAGGLWLGVLMLGLGVLAIVRRERGVVAK